MKRYSFKTINFDEEDSKYSVKIIYEVSRPKPRIDAELSFPLHKPYKRKPLRNQENLEHFSSLWFSLLEIPNIKR